MAEREGAARIAVFASGSGSNFQALLERFHGRPDAEARVVLLVASREGTGAEERAHAAGVPVTLLPKGLGAAGAEESRFLLSALRARSAELVVLAGWLRLVPAAVVRAFHGRMLNVHPALLPAFGGRGMYGRHVHRAVLASGARVSGPTVHLVDEAYDRGPILAQWPVPVLEEDDEESLAARVLAAEHRLLPAVVAALAGDRLSAAAADGGRLRLPWLRGERFLIEAEEGPRWLPAEEPAEGAVRPGGAGDGKGSE